MNLKAPPDKRLLRKALISFWKLFEKSEKAWETGVFYFYGMREQISAEAEADWAEEFWRYGWS